MKESTYILVVFLILLAFFTGVVALTAGCGASERAAARVATDTPSLCVKGEAHLECASHFIVSVE